MPKIRTHYDNLKVARDAPPEVVRAAYRSLSQKYHPDRNSDNPDAARIMAILNAAYEILSDPARRKEYDEWIALKESESVEYSTNATWAESQPTPPKAESGFSFYQHILENWGSYLLAIFFFLLLLDSFSATKPAVVPNNSGAPLTPRELSDAPAKARYIRPPIAPNGQPWPIKSSYVQGYKRLFYDGISEITIDNSRLNSDVFVKLFALDTPKPRPVRVCFIKAGGQFTLTKIRAGRYDVRYQDLDSGDLSKSEPIELKEIIQDGGVQYSTVTMTLYKVLHGNMRTFSIDETEFSDDPELSALSER